MNINLNNVKLRKIVSVKKHKVLPVTDIQVSHNDHLFNIKSVNGATNITHNSALISLSNLSDDRMRNAKMGRWFDENPNYSYANNSVAYTEKPDVGIFMKEWLALYESKSGERGIFNRDGAKRHIKNQGVRDHEFSFGLNPCVVGETLVAVADGRGNVPFSQLAEEGKDVLVYCLDDNGELTIAKMVNPRITGINVPIFEVELEGGHTCRVTGNHKFLVRDKGYIETKDLVVGDSLAVMSRWIERNNKKSGEFYYRLQYNNTNKAEHRVIYEYFFGKIENGYHIHHKDHNSLNNTIDNLQCVSLAEHNTIHNFNDVSGENNPNYNPTTNEEIIKHIEKLTKEKGRKIIKSEWKEYAEQHGLPLVFSKFRGLDMSDLFMAAAVSTGVDVIYKPNMLKAKLISELASGYDCEIVGGRILYHKVCEISGEPFDTFRKEEMVLPEHAKEHFSKMVKAGLKVVHDKKRNGLKTKQAQTYNNLKFSLGRDPMKKEWQVACKDGGVSFEMCRKSSPFLSYDDLKEYASGYNHKVVSVKEVGTADVYNGTVEKYHNFFIGGWEELTRKLKLKKQVFINNMQCGEVILRDSGLCNLSTTIMRPSDTKETIKDKIRIATILGTLQSTLTNFRFLGREWKRNAEEERLLGVSISGIMDNAFLSGREDREELKSFLQEMRSYISEVNKEYAELLGINPSVSWSVIKPEGNSSQLVNCSSGIHPRHAKYYLRRVQGDVTDPLVSMMKDMGVPCEPLKTQPLNTVVFSFPLKSPEDSVFRNDMTALEQLELYKLYKENYTTHNPSITVYVKEDEWVKVGAWVYENFDNIIGLTFLPHSDHIYTQAPYEDLTEEQYNDFLNKMPKHYDWSMLLAYEKEDNTTGAKELACVSGVCEI